METSPSELSPYTTIHASSTLGFIAKPGWIEEEGEERPLGRIPCERQRQRREQLGVVLVDRSIDQLPGVLDREAAVAVGEPALDRGEPAADRAERLDRKPAFMGPGACRDAMPRSERRVEPTRIVDAEVGEPRPDARLVDDAVAEMP